ncbi:MAG: glycosyltransferase family 2 protein [Coriobacteriia bacterium]|nr:glycosyltransferase family 2 protein [Coriobacteriia bacterium]
MSVNTPFFSIAMPAYNAEAVIQQAIESVLAQTFEAWELVVVDDGSTDGTAALVRDLAGSDERIVLVRQANAGCGAARDTAVRNSRAPYIVRLDTDDALLPEYLASMHRFISANPGYDIYSCNGWHLYPDGSRRLARPDERYAEEQSFTFADMLCACHIFTIAVFTRDIFDRVGGIRPDVYCEDLDFWLRAFAYSGATHRYTPEPLALYTISDTQMTADVERVLESRIGIYRDLIDSGRLAADREELARAAIERTHSDIWIYRRRTAITHASTRLLGERAGTWVSGAIHASSGALRPLLAPLAARLQRGRRRR